MLQVATPSQLYREPADETVGGFIGEGMVVPVEVRAVNGDGTCDADLFGHTRAHALRDLRNKLAPRRAPACARTTCGSSQPTDARRAGKSRSRHLSRRLLSRSKRMSKRESDVLLHLIAPEPFQLVPGAAIKLAGRRMAG